MCRETSRRTCADYAWRMGIQGVCTRGLNRLCLVQEDFLQDLCAFHRSRGIKNVSPDNFPDAILNGSRLDVYHLYREVTSRGGFR